MKSKQTKDFLDSIDYPGLLKTSFKSEVEKDSFPYNKIDFNGEDVYMIDINDLPKGFDFDIDKWVKIMKERPMEIFKSKPSLEESVEVLCKALSEDEDYYRSWLANIAMSFYDEFYNNLYLSVKGLEDGIIGLPTKEHISIIANKAADNFLKQLIK